MSFDEYYSSLEDTVITDSHLVLIVLAIFLVDVGMMTAYITSVPTERFEYEASLTKPNALEWEQTAFGTCVPRDPHLYWVFFGVVLLWNLLSFVPFSSFFPLLNL